MCLSRLCQSTACLDVLRLYGAAGWQVASVGRQLAPSGQPTTHAINICKQTLTWPDLDIFLHHLLVSFHAIPFHPSWRPHDANLESRVLRCLTPAAAGLHQRHHRLGRDVSTISAMLFRCLIRCAPLNIPASLPPCLPASLPPSSLTNARTLHQPEPVAAYYQSADLGSLTCDLRHKPSLSRAVFDFGATWQGLAGVLRLSARLCVAGDARHRPSSGSGPSKRKPPHTTEIKPLILLHTPEPAARDLDVAGSAGCGRSPRVRVFFSLLSAGPLCFDIRGVSAGSLVGQGIAPSS
eukprot:3656154-Rhodomonas_salina.7